MKTLAATGVIASALTMLSFQSVASATPVPVIHLSDGNNAGPQGDNDGPGAEQSSSSYISRDGKTYVVTVWMSSKVSDDDAPYQCKCSSVELSADGQPKLVADQVQLTNYNGDRPCNHPRTASDGTANILWLFGSDKGDATNVSTYAGVLDHMCQVKNSPTRISENANNNEGAPDIDFNGAGYFTGGYLSTGGTDTSIAVGLKLNDLGGGEVELEKTYLKGVVSPANIGRPAIVAASADKTLFCAAKGDNRPPEVGVQCAMIDAMTGTILYKQLIAASQPSEHIYMNQPSVGRLDYGYLAVQVLSSSGAGKNGGAKGSNTTNLYVLQPTDTSFIVKDHEVGVGSYQTHSAICAGAQGTDGVRRVGIMGAPITGNGQPVLQYANYDSALGISADKDADKWIIGWYGDSGKLANLYGQNPNTQGRDFLRCVADVPNPGFGQPLGYLPNVKTFFVTPHHGRIPGEEKNSMWLSFVPGHTSEVVTPDPPAQATDVALGPQGNDPIDSEPPPPASGGDDGNATGDDGDSTITVNQGGCSTSPASDASGPAWLLTLGLGLALSLRRKGASK